MPPAERDPAAVPRVIAEVVDTATGRTHRDDPVTPRTGGPAGNARMTAWIGLVFLALAVAECFTALGIWQMMSAHVLIGAAMVPVVVAKTGMTGWRILRYYTGDPAYRRAGPPPLLLRVLGPVVVLTGLAVLGSGLALIALGTRSWDTLLTVAGQRIDAITVHQASFGAWLVVVGMHGLARLVPAIRLARSGGRRRLAGAGARRAALVAMLAVAVVTGVVTLRLSTDWTHGFVGRPPFFGGGEGER